MMTMLAKTVQRSDNIHARKSEEFVKFTEQNAKKIGMKINVAKTNMLCITVAKNAIINSFINLPACGPIVGDQELKMLGFHFGHRPTAEVHIEKTRVKFLRKLWILRHLKNANTSKEDLCKIYSVYLWPVLEYVHVVYHCLLTDELSDKLEEMQNTALCLGRSLQMTVLP